VLAALPLILAVHVPTAAQVAKQLAREAHRCTGKLTLTGDGVGAVRVGSSVEAVRKACHVPVRKLKKGEAPPPANLLEIKIGMTPVQAEIAEGHVWRVIVDGGAFHTLDKIGVDSPLSAVLATGGARANQTEGVIYATNAANCGVAFALDYKPRRGEDRDNWTAEGLGRLPPDTKVARVLMSGCKPSG
jgi:hypothetical protein